MHTRLAISVAILLITATPSFAQPAAADLPDDIVEVSPDLFLLVYRAVRQNRVDMQVEAIRRANRFAASRGGVVVPISGDFDELNIAQRVYQYQFRVMSREEALALKPVFPDMLITVHNTGGCSSPGSQTAVLRALAQDENTLKMVSSPWPLPGIGSDPAPRDDDAPAICLPGHLCKPSQMCLPGWQCSPGIPPMPQTPLAPSTPPTASLR